MTETELAAEPDLRRARRERGRQAVIDTAYQIFMTGEERPAAAEIARRSGVSTSSLFRYFTSIDDLRGQVAERFLDQHRDLLDARPPDGATFEERSRAFADLRIQVGLTFGPIAQRLQARMFDEPGLASIRARFRTMLADQVDAYFEAELGAATPARRADLMAVIDSATSVEAFRILYESHGRTEPQVRRAWLTALDAILRSS